VRERPEWKACRAQLRAPFDAYHRNDQPEQIRKAYDGNAPVVLAVTDTQAVVLLRPHELVACEGSVDQLTKAIDRAADALGLEWPT
jgi:hypothetical protein